MMLREIRNVRQVDGESKRRWFFCHELDLVVWEDGYAISGFQLAYDKHRDEHSISWDKERGFVHYVVDDGESVAGVNSAPFLYTDGPFSRDRVLALFLDLSTDIPDDVAGFVEEKLREFNEPLQ